MSQTNHFTLLGHYKQCGIIEVISTSTKTIVDNVTSADNLDIYKSIYISESPFLYFLPSGIEKYLKHLEVIILENTQLMKITGDDLKPFCDLRGLFITSSNLTTLEEDLFANNEKIEILALTNSKIKSVSSGVFKSLTKLFDFDFRSNTCFNKKETHTKAVLKMIESIEEECKGVNENKDPKKDKDSSKDNEVNKEKDSTKDKEKDSSNDNDSSKDKDKKSNKDQDSDKESKTTIEENVKETTTEATE
ncbi:hypothetical protein PVAND_006392 [Polypedilum vanderplanki]|nr:hypothetical protein PVAND_006392 [Polypedilum vanderplanki]